jgi:hypothetical protein
MKLIDADATTILVAKGIGHGNCCAARCILIAYVHQLFAQALLSSPCTFVLLSTIAARFLVDARIFAEFSSIGISSSTCFIGVVDGFPLRFRIGKIAGSLWRCS